MNVLKVKGGLNASVLIGEIDIQELRKHQKNSDIKEGIYKKLPAGWDFGRANMKK